MVTVTLTFRPVWQCLTLETSISVAMTLEKDYDQERMGTFSWIWFLFSLWNLSFWFFLFQILTVYINIINETMGKGFGFLKLNKGDIFLLIFFPFAGKYLVYNYRTNFKMNLHCVHI